MLCTPEQRSTLHLTADWELAGYRCLVAGATSLRDTFVHTVVPALLAMLSPGAQAAQPSQKSLQGAESKSREIDEEERGCRIGNC